VYIECKLVTCIYIYL